MTTYTETSDVLPSNSANHLKAFVERIERLTEEKQALAEDIKEVYAEAVGTGFDRKAIAECIKRRKVQEDARIAAELLVDTYWHALNMVGK